MKVPSNPSIRLITDPHHKGLRAQAAMDLLLGDGANIVRGPDSKYRLEITPRVLRHCGLPPVCVPSAECSDPYEIICSLAAIMKQRVQNGSMDLWALLKAYGDTNDLLKPHRFCILRDGDFYVLYSHGASIIAKQFGAEFRTREIGHLAKLVGDVRNARASVEVYLGNTPFALSQTTEGKFLFTCDPESEVAMKLGNGGLVEEESIWPIVGKISEAVSEKGGYSAPGQRPHHVSHAPVFRPTASA